jgi:pilus assembly protein FimV
VIRLRQTIRKISRAGRLLLGAGLVLFPLHGHALGLGKLKVHSALNEPLNAEIDFTSISEKELKGLSASLASRAEFQSAGIERLPYLSLIHFTVAKRLDGRYFLQLRTDQQIVEPFLHMMLQLEWPGGRLVREYTALIDPPYQIAGKPTDIQAPRITPTAKVETIPTPTAPEPTPLPSATKATTPETEPLRIEPVPVEAPSPRPESVVTETEPIPAVAMTEEALLGPPAVGMGEIPLSQEGWPLDEAAPKVEPLGPAESVTSKATEDVITGVPSWTSPSDYVVKKGDTLWEIAEKYRTDTSLSMEQMILAIFKANQDAFFLNNVNNLKAGKILKMPERVEVEGIPRQNARREFKAQYDVWQEYKLKLASASRAIQVTEKAEPATVPKTPQAETKPEKPVAAKIKPVPAAKPEIKVAEKKPEPAPLKKSVPATSDKQPDELLKIVRATLEREKTASDKKTAETESKKDTAQKEQVALAERVTTLEESLESKQMETKELGDKIGEVKSQLKKESRLIELENQNLAQAQQPAEDKTATPVEADKPEAKAEAKPDAPKPVPPAAAPVKPEKPVVRRRVVPPPPEEKGMVDSVMGMLNDMMGNSLLPIVGGVAALLGGGILLVYLRRRQRSIAEFEESILSDALGAEGVSTTTEDTSGQTANTGDTSFLSDFSQGGMGNIHTDEVDPIAEAEVYLAYGRDETAEEILKEAIVKNPERHELKQKLLEIYYQRNDTGAFETLAEELYAALGGRGGQVWDKVEEMGRKLNPDNPMFRGSAPKTAPVAGDAAARSAPAMAAVSTKAPSDMDIQDAPGVETGSVSDLDFDLGGVETATPSADETSFDLEFNAESIDEQTPTDEKEESESLALGELDGSMVDLVEEPSETAHPGQKGGNGQLETGADETSWESEVEASAEVALEEESGGLTEEAMQQQWDETATKLDLAKAYIDMGDSEGARSILDEVLSEGSETQKKQAAELAAQIG